ncbi:acyl carrier protein [Nostoc sp. MS1]|uniref:acyl carrier protein n=1 Tax=Nostoc sp. MS1 TaxID=2764711 RepID=UPI001CC5F602|nr:acyl carrier protein [Nostoc sp. MS1]BCL38650.1 hypothetical protein NSMS1_50970 [Nostoc sp. MS1]
MSNIFNHIQKAISNTNNAITQATARQNKLQNQYTEAKAKSHSAHEAALKAAYKNESSLAMQSLSQEILQETVANLLQSQIQEQIVSIEVLNNNLETLNNIKIILEQCMENKTSNNTQLLTTELNTQHLDNENLKSQNILFERVKKIIAEQTSFPVENINLEHSLVLGGYFSAFLSSSNYHEVPSNDLGMDNLDGIELLMAIEEEFDIEISDAEAETVRTVQELLNIISFKLNKK